MRDYLKYKNEIIECTKWLMVHGFFGTLRGTGGNVSCRIRGENAFAITPSSLPYDTLKPDDICILDFNMRTIEGTRKPSMESGLHLKAYQRRKDVNAVIHTHQTYASIFAVMKRPIPPLFDEVTMHIGHVVDVIPYALSGSPELANNVANTLDNMCQCYLMQNHGALSLGVTLEKAWQNVELLEKVAKVYYRALSVGSEITFIPNDIVELLKEVRKAELNQ